VRALVKRTGFNENYVSRILDLAVLSPEITDAFAAIVTHLSPSHKLIANLEIDWMRQKLRRIGIPTVREGRPWPVVVETPG
jgi:hypothetical protein